MTQHALLGICGSLRAPSVNRKLLAEAIRLYGPVEHRIADLRLPLYDGDLESSEGIPQSVQTLAAEIAGADAVIIASPEYNKAITGVLKNAPDWVSRVKGNPWRDGETGQYMLRHALAPFRPRFSSGPFVMVADGANQFDTDGRLTNDRAAAALEQAMQVLRTEVEHARAS